MSKKVIQFWKFILIFLFALKSFVVSQSSSGCGPRSWDEYWKLSTHSPSGGVIKVYTKGHGGRIECLYAEVGPEDLDTGTSITQAMKDHVRLQDANNISDQAGQIVFKKLGGPGNVTFNVFPQNGKRVNTLWKNRGSQIYEDLKETSPADSERFYKLTYRFQYDNQSARPKRPTGWTWHIVSRNGTVWFDKFANPVN